ASKAAKDGTELDTDRTSPQDCNRLGNRLQSDRFVARDDPLAIDLDSRNASRLRSRRDDDFLARGERLLLSLGDLNCPFTHKPAAAFDPIDLVLLEQKCDPVGQTSDDAILSRLHLVHVEADRGVAKRETPL